MLGQLSVLAQTHTSHTQTSHITHRHITYIIHHTHHVLHRASPHTQTHTSQILHTRNTHYTQRHITQIHIDTNITYRHTSHRDISPINTHITLLTHTSHITHITCYTSRISPHTHRHIHITGITHTAQTQDTDTHTNIHIMHTSWSHRYTQTHTSHITCITQSIYYTEHPPTDTHYACQTHHPSHTDTLIIIIHRHTEMCVISHTSYIDTIQTHHTSPITHRKHPLYTQTHT